MNREERIEFVRERIKLFVNPEVQHQGAVQKAINDVTIEIVDRWTEDLVEERRLVLFFCSHLF
jgi:hypothetical protein